MFLYQCILLTLVVPFPLDRDEKEYGGRVIVSYFIDGDNNFFQGYTRLSNVQFNNGGQRDHVENYDPRFSLAFLNNAESTGKTESYVKKCAFNYNYNTAIGIFGDATKILIEVLGLTHMI